MKRNVLPILLAALILAGCLSALRIPALAVSFSDVKPGDWYEKYVTPLANAGVINGYPDGTFKPNQTVTAGEALKMILLAAGFEIPAKTDAHWASGYRSFALARNMVDQSDITDLDASIPRQTVAKLAANALGLDQSEKPSVFSDTKSGYVMALNGLGIIGGYPDGTFRPESFLTRAELSAIVLRIMNVKNGQPAESVPEIPSGGEGGGLVDGGTGTGDSSDFDDVIGDGGEGEETGAGSGDAGEPEPDAGDDEPGWGKLH